MASTATYQCKECTKPFTARTADRARGWARFCSKACKAVKQVKKTGWAGPGSGVRPGKKYPRHAGVSKMTHRFCATCGDNAVNGVYRADGSIEWGCSLHHWDNTTHPFSSDAWGQW